MSDFRIIGDDGSLFGSSLIPFSFDVIFHCFLSDAKLTFFNALDRSPSLGRTGVRVNQYPARLLARYCGAAIFVRTPPTVFSLSRERHGH
jgi:hypothetical protein